MRLGCCGDADDDDDDNDGDDDDGFDVWEFFRSLNMTTL